MDSGDYSVVMSDARSLGRYGVRRNRMLGWNRSGRWWCQGTLAPYVQKRNPQITQRKLSHLWSDYLYQEAFVTRCQAFYVYQAQVFQVLADITAADFRNALGNHNKSFRNSGSRLFFVAVTKLSGNDFSSWILPTQVLQPNAWSYCWYPKAMLFVKTGSRWRTFLRRLVDGVGGATGPSKVQTVGAP